MRSRFAIRGRRRRPCSENRSEGDDAMNVKLDIDCSPEEARRFFGLPDLAPVHAAYVARMTRMVDEGLSAADLEQAMKTWMGGFSGFADLQKAMFAAMGGQRGGEQTD